MKIRKLNIIRLTHIIISMVILVLFIMGASPQSPRKKDTILRQTEKSRASLILNQSKIQKVSDIPLLKNFFRAEELGEMTNFCRNLNLKPLDTPVKLYNGQLKKNQQAHYAILDIEVGTKNLQHCADAIMRLRAEYLFAEKQFDKITFNFTSGDVCAWQKWQQGWRPTIMSNQVKWHQSQAADNSYQNFRQYLNLVFTYAGSASLSKELKTVAYKTMQIGDVFIKGGFPGHAVIVLDMALNNNKEKIYLLAQSYMPAQDIHILHNLNNTQYSPWYKLEEIDEIKTPEWTFTIHDLKRF